MVRIYNSSLEVACRMAKVLVAIYPSSLSLERLICFDFILVNLKDFL
ncbi:TPA: ABC-three component system middle component 2, partial [Escherichia coli]